MSAISLIYKTRSNSMKHCSTFFLVLKGVTQQVGETSRLHSLTGRVVRKRGNYPETGGRQVGRIGNGKSACRKRSPRLALILDGSQATRKLTQTRFIPGMFLQRFHGFDDVLLRCTGIDCAET